MPRLPDKYTLYQLCAQHPTLDAAMLRAIHADLSGRAREGLILGEDFSGHAALSRAWCRADPKGRAVAVDHDPEALSRATRHPRLRTILADVRTVTAPADVIGILNFSIGELHDRRDLVRYLRHARARLRAGGCLVCDLYGGTDAFTPKSLRARALLPDGRMVVYRWQQRTADPLTARVENAMHFQVFPRARSARAQSTRTPAARSKRPPAPELSLADAFVYRWRLWSPAELADALRDAGFKRTEFFQRAPGAIDSDGLHYPVRIQGPRELPPSFNIFVAGAP